MAMVFSDCILPLDSNHGFNGLARLFYDCTIRNYVMEHRLACKSPFLGDKYIYTLCCLFLCFKFCDFLLRFQLSCLGYSLLITLFSGKML